eukprot:ANDGO_00676.mRNA.1 Polyamine oxidase 3
MTAPLRIAIVGAGISGISAAKTLLEQAGRQGVSISITMFEARDRIAGRMFTDENGFDHGASWVHGTSRSPLNPICKHYGFELVESSFDKNAFLFRSPETNERIPKDVTYDMMRTHDEAMCLFEEDWFVSSIHPRADTKHAWGQAVDHILQKKKGISRGGLSADERKALEFYYTLEEHIAGGTFDKVPARRFALYDEGDGHSMLRGGYAQLPKAMFRDVEKLASGMKPGSFSLRLNTVVRKVEVPVSSPSVVIEISASSAASKVAFERFDYALVTVPVAIMRNKSIKFVPELCPEMESFFTNDMQFNGVEKLFLEFDTNFWGEEAYFAAVYPDSEHVDRSRLYWNCIDYSPFVGNGRSVLLMWMHREDLLPLDPGKMKDGTYLALGMEWLSRAFPEAGVGSKAKLIKSVLTEWGTDPFAGGSWSCPGFPKNLADLDNERADAYFDNVQRFHAGRVLFSGEATHRTWFSCVHGALFTGQSQAMKILSAAFPLSSKL